MALRTTITHCESKSVTNYIVVVKFTSGHLKLSEEDIGTNIVHTVSKQPSRKSIEVEACVIT